MKEFYSILLGREEESNNSLFYKPIIEFLLFGFKQVIGITFGLSLVLGFLLTMNSNYRYDILFIYALCIQVLLYKINFERKRDILVVTIFHLIGLSMELIEVSLNHSWSYNSTGFFYIASVPIFTGFMYASVGSFMAKEFKLLRLRLVNMPSNKVLIILSIMIYINFILNNHIYDFRYILLIATVIIYRKSSLYFTPSLKEYKFNIPLAFLLIGFFIWIAENISTYLGIWTYPNQVPVWHFVHLSKITSWMLLSIVSFNLVYILIYKHNSRHKKSK